MGAGVADFPAVLVAEAGLVVGVELGVGTGQALLDGGELLGGGVLALLDGGVLDGAGRVAGGAGGVAGGAGGVAGTAGGVGAGGVVVLTGLLTTGVITVEPEYSASSPSTSLR